MGNVEAGAAGQASDSTAGGKALATSSSLERASSDPHLEFHRKQAALGATRDLTSSFCARRRRLHVDTTTHTKLSWVELTLLGFVDDASNDLDTAIALSLVQTFHSQLNKRRARALEEAGHKAKECPHCQRRYGFLAAKVDCCALCCELRCNKCLLLPLDVGELMLSVLGKGHTIPDSLVSNTLQGFGVDAAYRKRAFLFGHLGGDDDDDKLLSELFKHTDNAFTFARTNPLLHCQRCHFFLERLIFAQHIKRFQHPMQPVQQGLWKSIQSLTRYLAQLRGLTAQLLKYPPDDLLEDDDNSTQLTPTQLPPDMRQGMLASADELVQVIQPEFTSLFKQLDSLAEFVKGAKAGHGLPGRNKVETYLDAQVGANMEGQVRRFLKKHWQRFKKDRAALRGLHG